MRKSQNIFFTIFLRDMFVLFSSSVLYELPQVTVNLPQHISHQIIDEIRDFEIESVS